MNRIPDHGPIDRILDRHLPGLTGERREIARDRLGGLIMLLIRIAIRQAKEAELDSRGSGAGDRMDSSPPPT